MVYRGGMQTSVFAAAPTFFIRHFLQPHVTKRAIQRLVSTHPHFVACMNDLLFHNHIYPLRHKLYRFALRITGNAHEAEDVVQEVMEKVWKQAPEQSQSVQNWEAWCMTLTRNRSVDKTRRKSSTPLEHAPEPSHADTPSSAAESQDMIRQIQMLMQQLPEKQRLVMYLRDVEEMAYEEIAQALDISLDQVKVNLHRARKTIRQGLLTYIS